MMLSPRKKDKTPKHEKSGQKTRRRFFIRKRTTKTAPSSPQSDCTSETEELSVGLNGSNIEDNKITPTGHKISPIDVIIKTFQIENGEKKFDDDLDEDDHFDYTLLQEYIECVVCEKESVEGTQQEKNPDDIVSAPIEREEYLFFKENEDGYPEIEVITYKQSQPFYFDTMEEESQLPQSEIFQAPSPLKKSLTLCSEKSFVCENCNNCLDTPNIHPTDWPQRPLLLRATPGSGTKIIGVRFSSRDEYFDVPWPKALKKFWCTNDECQSSSTASAEDRRFCPKCQILPINNGNEAPGESLVTDFESDLFKGTLLVRIRDSSGSTREQDEKGSGYFFGLNRTYQAVIRGHFKDNPPKCNDHEKNKPTGPVMSECVTGQVFSKPLGRRPPLFVRSVALKVISVFAPQLQAKFDGEVPHFLSPLTSMPQTLNVKEKRNQMEKRLSSDSIEKIMEEPCELSNSLLGSIDPTCSVYQQIQHKSSSTSQLPAVWVKNRKKIFDKLFAKKAEVPVFNSGENVEYTFEFLQHLLNYHKFQIELGNLGKLDLHPMLNGQPLKIMAAHQSVQNDALKSIWSFDIWHESVCEKAALPPKI